jgi:hypothetical protein
MAMVHILILLSLLLSILVPPLPLGTPLGLHLSQVPKQRSDQWHHLWPELLSCFPVPGSQGSQANGVIANSYTMRCRSQCFCDTLSHWSLPVAH